MHKDAPASRGPSLVHLFPHGRHKRASLFARPGDSPAIARSGILAVLLAIRGRFVLVAMLSFPDEGLAALAPSSLVPFYGPKKGGAPVHTTRDSQGAPGRMVIAPE